LLNKEQKYMIISEYIFVSSFILSDMIHQDALSE